MQQIVKCVNFCGDADTTGSICAQLAGALYGFDAIEPHWVVEMNRWADGEIELRAVLLFLMGEKQPAAVEPGAEPGAGSAE